MSGPRLLLVEDDEVTRAAVAANFTGHGYVVHEARDADAALRAWEKVAARRHSSRSRAPRSRRHDSDPARPPRGDDAHPRAVRPRAGGRTRSGPWRQARTTTSPSRSASARSGLASRRSSGDPAARRGGVRRAAQRLDHARPRAARRHRPRHRARSHAARVRAAEADADRAGARADPRRLLRAVWGTAYSEEGHYLHVYVSRLRRKLAAADPDGDARDLMIAEPGVGYRVRRRRPTADHAVRRYGVAPLT